MLYEQINVECYSGYRIDERPVAFIYQDRRWEIAEIIDRWYEGGIDPSRPVFNYFKVRTSEGNIFLLRNDPSLDQWYLHFPPRMN